MSQNAELLPKIEHELTRFIEEHTCNERLQRAMSYSIDAGGKRLRPLLVLSTAAAFGKELTEADYQVAASVEMVHTYSLIHDDLPAMDDDDLRRGQPTNHKVFGEAAAILAGDALLTGAFQLLSLSQIEPSEKVLLMQLLSRASGSEGMVAGQMADIEGEARQLSLEELILVHRKKTGALIQFAVMAGGVLAQQPAEVIDLLAEFSEHLGLAFQIRDDLLDVISTEAELGKKVGRDQELQKSTYPALLGEQGARTALAAELEQADQTLTRLQQLVPEFQAAHLSSYLNQLSL